MDPAVRDPIIAALPRLGSFAVSLCGALQTQDLVQQNLLNACSKIGLFGANNPILPRLISPAARAAHAAMVPGASQGVDVEHPFQPEVCLHDISFFAFDLAHGELFEPVLSLASEQQCVPRRAGLRRTACLSRSSYVYYTVPFK